MISYGFSTLGCPNYSVDEVIAIAVANVFRGVEIRFIRGTVDIASLAIRFCVENPDLTTTVAGTANPANMSNILKWVDEPLDRQLLAEVQAILEPVKDVLWPVGLPENSDNLEAGL